MVREAWPDGASLNLTAEFPLSQEQGRGRRSGVSRLLFSMSNASGDCQVSRHIENGAAHIE